MNRMPGRVTVVEVGPRDGLQNESATIPTAEKIAFVDALSAAGLPVVEVSAFVSPKWVPQMADAAEVYAGITRRPGTRYPALVPNLAGLDRAKAAGVDEIAIFAAASETFSKRNINQTIDQSLETYRAVAHHRSSGPDRCHRHCRWHRRVAVESWSTSSRTGCPVRHMPGRAVG